VADRDGNSYPDGVEQSCRALYSLLLAFVLMFSRLV
jgi:hypothetical protein